MEQTSTGIVTTPTDSASLHYSLSACLVFQTTLHWNATRVDLDEKK